MTRSTKLSGAPLILIGVILVGCESQAYLTIHSQPAGAFITERGTSTAFGSAPVTVYYDKWILKANRTADGCYLVKGFDAKWVSGATATLETIRLCGSASGSYVITYSRNRSSPGFEKDAEFGLKVQAVRAQQQAAYAAQQQATAAEVAAISSLFNSWSTNNSSDVRLSCSSYQVRDTIYTDCN